MPDVLDIAICEDEINEEEKLTALLDEAEIKNTYTVFTNGEEFLSSFQKGKYDLLLMDIYIEGSITGIDTVKKVRQIDCDIPVVFITTSKEHALESYRLSAIKYIEKPVSKNQIYDALHLAKLKKEDAPSLHIKKNGIPEKILLSDILYIEQQKRQVFIFLRNGEEISCYEKISVLSEQLQGHDFFVPHKSFVVNLCFAKHIDMELKCFVMENGKNIPIKREQQSSAKKALEDFIFNKIRRL